MNQHASTKDLNLANLNLVARGAIARAFDHCLHMATQDVVDRPGDKGARKVVLEIELKPVLDQNSAVLDTITHKFRVDTRIPKRVSAEYPMLPMKDGHVTFQPNSPGDPRQYDMFTDEQEEAKAAEGDEPTATPDDEAETDGNTNIGEA